MANMPPANMPPPSIDQPVGSGTNVTVPPGSQPLGIQPVTVSGWAVAPIESGTGISAVDVFMDGLPEQGGTFIGTATYGLPRPDVASAFNRPDWTDSGYALTWTPRNLAAGNHTFTVVAYSTSGERAEQTVTAMNCLCAQPSSASITAPQTIAIEPGVGAIEDVGGPDLVIDRRSGDGLTE
jgi:hypothetical protein